MSIKKPKPGEPGGAPFVTPAKNLSRPVANQAVEALRGELKQLSTDLAAIAAGNAGSTFAKGDRDRLEARIAALKSVLAGLDPDSLNLS
jgi:hypothetical protein